MLHRGGIMEKNKCCNNCIHSTCNSVPNDDYGDLVWLECDLSKKVVDEDDGMDCIEYKEY